MKTYTIAELTAMSSGELISHIHELMWELGICAACGGQLYHHMDEPFYTCQKCGTSGEATTIPLVQQRLVAQVQAVKRVLRDPAAIKSKMKPSTVAEMEQMIERGCSTPGCTHDDHKELFLKQRCHPGGGLDVCYEKGTGVVNVTCRQCKRPVLDIGVALA